MNKYKGINYRVMRSNRGTVNTVYVFFSGLTEQFDTIKQAKRYITIITQDEKTA